MALTITTAAPVGIYNGRFGGVVTPYLVSAGGTATTLVRVLAAGYCHAILPGQINSDGATNILVYAHDGTASTQIDSWDWTCAGAYPTPLIVAPIANSIILKSSTTQNITCANLFVETFDPTKAACQL